MDPSHPTAPDHHSHIPLAATICALGIAQIVSWGSFFYTIAVLGENMGRDLGVSQSMLFGAFTVSLVLSGLAAPTVGKLIDERGGRGILAIGSCIGGVALIMLATAIGPLSLFLGWIVAGFAMAVCLYDAAFMALNQIAGPSYRKAVTALTLFGGFASTVFWPLSQLLMDAIGWRQTLTVYAALQILLCLPLHLWVMPRRPRPLLAHPHQPVISDAPEVVKPPPDYGWLAAALALGAFVLSGLALHMISLLKSAGMSARDAVFVASLMGPVQVLGRILELGFARNIGPVAIGSIMFVLLGLALAALFFVQGLTPLAFVFTMLFGFANGLMTIVRGTVPAVLFGREGFGLLLGKIARPAFIARALAPFVFSAVLTAGLARGDAILALAACVALALTLYQLAIRRLSGAGPSS